MVLIVTVVLSSQPVASAAEQETEAGDPSYASDHVLVKLEPDVSEERLPAASVESTQGGWHLVPVPAGMTPGDLVEELESQGGVEAASVDPVVQLDPISEPVPLGHVPTVGINDPLASYQWHFSVLQLEKVWADNTGGDVVVAVVDTGISPDGEDLTCHTFVSPYNAITGIAGMAGASDDHGHGTHVAGTVAQCTNNGVGVAGVAFDAALMPVKVLNSSGTGFISDIAEGIDWARIHGADVINLSLGCFTCGNQMIEEAIEAAVSDGVVVVAAAGNSHASSIFYPASHPDVIAVGATDYRNVRAPYSNQGSELDLVAPGGDHDRDDNGDGQPDGVLQETFGSDEVWGYYYMDGTSMATAHVSGIAALLLAKFPEAEPAGVRDVLERTAFDLGNAGFDSSYGHGVVQVHEALTYDITPPTWPNHAEVVVDRFGETSLTISWPRASDNRGLVYYRPILDGKTWPVQERRRVFGPGLDPGSVYRFEVAASDALGNESQPLGATVRTARSFADTVEHLFYNDILWMSGMDITRGCNPPLNDLFCPDDPVIRGQMAAFIVRALGLTLEAHPGFDDVPVDSTFFLDIGKLATSGITRGCNPPTNDRYCPDGQVTRAQMAAFLVRALGLTATTHPGFDDVPADSTFAQDIGKLATAGITRGCNPPVNDRFCPDDPITRGELAAFLHRALGR